MVHKPFVSLHVVFARRTVCRTRRDDFRRSRHLGAKVPDSKSLPVLAITAAERPRCRRGRLTAACEGDETRSNSRRSTTQYASRVPVCLFVNIHAIGAALRSDLPPFRATIHVQKSGQPPHRLASPRQVRQLAVLIQRTMRKTRYDHRVTSSSRGSGAC